MTRRQARTSKMSRIRRQKSRLPLRLRKRSDFFSSLLEPDGEWNDYLQAMSGFPTGTGLERISVADYIVYDAASTGCNWPVPAGYGSLVAASLPRAIDSRLSTPVESIELDLRAVVLGTPVGAVRTRAVILTVSTAVVAGGTIMLQDEPDPWRHAAARLPLGRNEKLFLEITGDSPFVH
jgi:monoamine oxidase